MVIVVVACMLNFLSTYAFSNEHVQKDILPLPVMPATIIAGQVVLVPVLSSLRSPFPLCMMPGVPSRFFSHQYPREFHLSLLKQLIDDKSLPELSALLPLGFHYDTSDLYIYALDKGFGKGALLMAAARRPDYHEIVQDAMTQDHGVHIAAKFDDAVTLKHMVDRGANIEDTDAQGCTPLHIAARRGNIASLVYLLSVGACVQTVDHDYQGVMHHAVLANNLPIIMALLRAGAPVNVISCQDLYPDTLAMKRGHYSLAPLLQGHDENALLQAIYYKDLKNVQHCLALGYRPDIVLSDGIRPLDAAFQFYHKDTIHELMKAFEFYVPA